MKLADYIEKKKLSAAAMADKIGVPRHTMERYLAGRLPVPEFVVAIYRATDGRVQPNDFYDLPPRQVRR